jgi:Beta-L-arabinofuranosidase, GH127 catalytic domain/Beta-L-arabinofuranosidase, GH127 middle domain/Concanavalin A-like lectin/glucanases superfamily
MKRRDFLKRGIAAVGTTAIYGLGGQKSQAASPAESRVLTQFKPVKSGGHYFPNRAPLQPSAFMKLPVGSIAPKGWLRTQLEIQANGLNGRMMEVSDYLDLKTSGWVIPANNGFEELTYWLRGFAPLGYVLGNERIMDMTKRWVTGIMATQQPDGWFGPTRLKMSMEGGPDFWPHMPVLYAIRAYQEYTGDPAVLPFITRYFQFQNLQPVAAFGRGWGAFRWGDNIDSIYWLYNRTGDTFLLDLVKKIHANSAPYTGQYPPTYHNVNLSQGFREPAQYGLLDSDSKFVAATQRMYDTIYSNFGQFAGGGFAGDEGCRAGFTDPRQGLETCGIVELMLSYEILTRITGNPAWTDHCEQIMFNLLPAALDPLQKGCHYVTSANSSALRNIGAAHRQYDDSPMAMQTYRPGIHYYRCCPHNYGMGWPMFAENLWLATNDGGLCASLYASSEVTAKVADGSTVNIVTETEYHFRDTIKLTVAAAKAVQFPLYLRVPKWCQGFTARINGQPVSAQVKAQSYLMLDRLWKPGDVVTLHLLMQTVVNEWTKTKNAVSVSRGPLEYSLAIKEDWYQSGGTQKWPHYDINPGSAWNYGLVLDESNPDHSFDLVQKGRRLAGNPFTTEQNPLELRVQAKKIPQWRDDSDGFTPVLQTSPALSGEAVETVSLIPMGAARLRLTTFPTIANSATGHEWQSTAVYLASVKSSQDHDFPWTSQCLLYNTQPASSHDTRSPRAAFNSRGTGEWVQYKFPNPVKLSAAAAYWFEDIKSPGGWYPNSGHFKVPKAWHVEYRDKDAWKPVAITGDYGVVLNQKNRVEFESVVTSAVRLVIEPDDAPAALYRFDLFNASLMLVPTVTDQAAAMLKDDSLADHSAAGGLAMVASFQADRITEKSERNEVTTWLDGSPGVNDAISTGESAPTLVRDAINGLPALHFDASHRQRLVFDRPVQDDFTIAVVFRSTQGIGQGTNYFEGAGLVQGEVGGVTDDFGLALNAKGQLVAGTGKPDMSIASPPGFNDGKAHLAIFERVKATGTFALYVDGNKVAVSKAGTQSLNAPPQLGIGAQANGANCLTGDIGEVAVYAQALSESERKALEDRLMAKWGIKS